MARFGDSDKKSREAYQQHNGWFKGTMKWFSKKLNPFGGDD